jgi:hypothetical protein
VEDIRSYRAKSTSRNLSTQNLPFPRIKVDFRLSVNLLDAYPTLIPTPVQPIRYHTPEEEIM